VTSSSTAKPATKAKAKASHAPAAEGSAAIFSDYAERAVLIPVGAALIARDRVVTSVNTTISNYSSSSKAQAQLRRFERRGTTARKRLEREVRKARVRFERELRQRRREIERTVSDLEARRDAVVKKPSELANRVPDLANRVPELANRVPDLANQVQERILSLV
jgi:seryl-tRNA synthetase